VCKLYHVIASFDDKLMVATLVSNGFALPAEETKNMIATSPQCVGFPSFSPLFRVV
jgi:hypothetical protein